MPAWTLRGLPPALLCVAALGATAQTPSAAPRPADPTDASVPVPAPVYTSVLGTPRRAADDRPTSWREANDTAARIGGWRTYLRLAQTPEGAASTPAAAAPTDRPPHHDHNHDHGPKGPARP
jgi:hypothetical protein